MAEYHSIRVKLSDCQLDKAKNMTGIILWSDMTGIDKNNLQHNPLLTNRQIAGLRKDFPIKPSKDIKLWNAQLCKIIQSDEFLSWLLGSLMKVGLPLIKHILTPLVKSVLIPLGLTAEA